MPRADREARSGFVRSVEITTRWSDNDVYHHVNNVVFYSFFDTAVNTLLVESGVLDFRSSHVVGLVVETGCQYFEPVAFPDRIAAGVRVAHVGRSSVRYEVGVFANDSPLAAAQGFFVHVYVDRRTNRPVELPADLRSLVESLKTPSAA